MFDYSNQPHIKVTVSRSAATYNTSPGPAPATTAVSAGAGRMRRRVQHRTIQHRTWGESPQGDITDQLKADVTVSLWLSAGVQPGVAGSRLTALLSTVQCPGSTGERRRQPLSVRESTGAINLGDKRVHEN